MQGRGNGKDGSGRMADLPREETTEELVTKLVELRHKLGSQLLESLLESAEKQGVNREQIATSAGITVEDIDRYLKEGVSLKDRKDLIMLGRALEETLESQELGEDTTDDLLVSYGLAPPNRAEFYIREHNLEGKEADQVRERFRLFDQMIERYPQLLEEHHPLFLFLGFQLASLFAEQHAELETSRDEIKLVKLRDCKEMEAQLIRIDNAPQMERYFYPTLLLASKLGEPMSAKGIAALLYLAISIFGKKMLLTPDQLQVFYLYVTGKPQFVDALVENLEVAQEVKDTLQADKERLY